MQNVEVSHERPKLHAHTTISSGAHGNVSRLDSSTHRALHEAELQK